MRFVLALSVLLAGSADGQVSFSNFASTAGLGLVPNAAQSGSVLRLTNSVISTRGAAWWATPVPVEAGFETTFRWQTSSPIGGGGDGFTFTIQNDPRGITALGNHAAALCYGVFATNPATTAIANSLTVEFDMYLSNFGGYSDLSANEISIHTGGTGPNSHSEGFSLGRINAGVNMKNGAVHTGRIRYTPGTLSVFYDNLSTAILTVPYRFATGGIHILPNTPVGGLSLLNGSAYVGFTGSGGSAYMNQDLLDWTFDGATNDPCFSNTFGPGGDVLAISGSAGGTAHYVGLPINSGFSLDLAAPPGAFVADYLVFMKIGAPLPGGAYALPWGNFCFAPSLLVPDPTIFLLTDTLALGGIIPGALAPTSLPVLSGLPIPVTLTLQGVMIGTTGVGNTNSVILELY